MVTACLICDGIRCSCYSCNERDKTKIVTLMCMGCQHLFWRLVRQKGPFEQYDLEVRLITELEKIANERNIR